MKTARQQAKEKGLMFYFTGKPCKRGHVANRRVVNCMCYECELEASHGKAEYKKQWYEKNKQKILTKAAQSYNDNPESKIAYACAYQKQNLRKIIEGRKQRINRDPVYAIKERIRCLIKESIRKLGSSKSTKTAQILGCSSADLRKHIERQFVRGMSWENMGKWHIDHIVPISSAKSVDEVIALNHHTNLRPLWAEDNLRKSNRMEFMI